MRIQRKLYLTCILTALSLMLGACGNSSDSDPEPDPTSFTVSANATAGGTIAPSSVDVDMGDTTSFTISANTGFSIDSVSGCGGSLVGNSYTTASVTADCTVSASFIINTYNVNATAGSGGIIDPASSVISHGDTTSFTITPDSGFVIGNVSGCSGSLVGNSYTTDAVISDCTVSANFVIKSYNVSATAGSGGSIDPASITISHGATTSFTVTPDSGFVIDNVIGCSGSLAGNSYTTGAVTGNCTVSANFSTSTHTVNATAGDGGIIDPASSIVSHGDTTSFTVTPDSGFVIDNVSGCSGSLAGNSYTTAAVTSNCTVSASFTTSTHTVNSTSGDGGVITPASSVISHGDTTSFTLMPDLFFVIDNVSGCGGSLVGNSYTTAAITADCTVNANFVIRSYTVTASAGSGGSIDPASINVPHITTTSFTVTPDIGFDIDNVSGCGGSLVGNSYTIAPAVADCTVSASFTTSTHTVNATSGDGGVITPASSVVSHGDTTSFTLMPDLFFVIDNVSGCGGSLVGNSYTTAAVTSDCTVSANFVIRSYTVNAIAGSGGSIDPASINVPHITTTSFTVTPDIGYAIDNVSGCNGSLVGNSYTIAPAVADCTVSANFVINTYTVNATAGSGGSIDPASSVVSHGDTISFTITADSGFVIDSVSGCSGSLSGNNYTTGAVISDCTVTANFSVSTHTVSATAGSGGSIDPASITVSHGDTTSFTLTPDSGFVIDSVSGCSGSLAGNSYTTGAVISDCTVTANFSASTHTVSASAGSGGSIDPATITISHGDTTSFTLTPDSGFVIDSVSGCSGSLTGNSYTTAAVTSDCTVSANFVIGTYTVNTAAGIGGTVSPASVNVADGDTASFTITADSGYTIGSAIGCDGSLSGNNYTTGEVTADCTVTVFFGGGPATAVLPVLIGTQTKTFNFTWTDAGNATHYKMLEDPDSLSGYTQVGSDIPQGTQTFDHLVPLFARIKARYILQSCNALACTDSTPVRVFNNDALPMLVDSIGYVKASNTDSADEFGFTVSLSGDGSTLAVGVPYESSDAVGINGEQDENLAPKAGAVYVFSRDGLLWSQQAYIKASNTGTADEFGYAVSLSDDGNTLAVGAHFESNSAVGINGDQDESLASKAGAAYVFSRDGLLWSQQAYIKASNTGIEDEFGTSVSLSGDGNTLAVGAHLEDSNATGLEGNETGTEGDSGAVYVFSRSGVSWSQQNYVKASNTGANDWFGLMVSLSKDGNTLAVSALQEESNATDINGNQADNSNGNEGGNSIGAGAVYVFIRNASSWEQEAYVKASNTGANDWFGRGLSLSEDGNTMAVGAPFESSSSSGIDGDQNNDNRSQAGAVYVFSRSGSNWSQQTYLKADLAGVLHLFGGVVSLSDDGNTLAVGVPLQSGRASAGFSSGGSTLPVEASVVHSGAAYVFNRNVNGTTWVRQAFLKVPHIGGTILEDRFGFFLDLSGDGNTLAVSASKEDSSATGINGDDTDELAENSGAVYLY